ncbi:DUF4439 domain-containing protein, partial [Streptomyces sp. NPDC002586]
RRRCRPRGRTRRGPGPHDLGRHPGGRDHRHLRRVAAAAALREAAVRALRWSGQSVAFPGLAERADGGTGAAGTTPSAAASATP